MIVPFALLTLLGSAVLGQHKPHFVPPRSVIVQMFEWPFADIARECEQFLGPHGFGAVQLPVVTENLIVPGRPWWERYQPISYRIDTRSGNASALRDMITRCHRHDIRVYVDIVLNHMAAEPPAGAPARGHGGSMAVPANRSFPAVPYDAEHFHRPCEISGYFDAHMVRNCDLNGLPDLDQSLETVRSSIARFLDELVEMGVSGFRVGSCKHMWPNDLKLMYQRVRDLPWQMGFEEGARPFIVQEVNDNGMEPISKTEYTFAGTVLEFWYATHLADVFTGKKLINALRDIGPAEGFVHSADAVVYVDNHDIQRNNPETLSFYQPFEYQQAIIFMLAHDYGIVRLMTSYEFGDDTGIGPPTKRDNIDSIRSPFDDAADDDEDDTHRGWVAEHRWPPIVQMVGWRMAVIDVPITSWRDYSLQQVAFCRGDRGFIAFNGDSTADFQANAIPVCVPPGLYCDVITRDLNGNCGRTVMVDANRTANIFIANAQKAKDVGDLPILAIHVEAMMV